MTYFFSTGDLVSSLWMAPSDFDLLCPCLSFNRGERVLGLAVLLFSGAPLERVTSRGEGKINTYTCQLDLRPQKYIKKHANEWPRELPFITKLRCYHGNHHSPAVLSRRVVSLLDERGLSLIEIFLGLRGELPPLPRPSLLRGEEDDSLGGEPKIRSHSSF